MPTLTGKIQLRVPANSQTGQQLRIRGKGLIGKINNGDLYAVLKVVMPSGLNNDTKRQWEVLSKAAAFDPRAQWSET
jgi:curved DNA-binding protein